jgi:ABC-type transport system involved in multi-copper enzyme maturation permease subunit
MLDAISAEALKFTRHRATWGLVWVWPIGVLLIGMIGIGVGLTQSGGGGDGARDANAAVWIANAAGFWNVPGHAFGRYLIGAFIAVVFAGEYGWNTWKLIVPHRSRTTLIAAKYIATLALLTIGFALASFLFNAISWLIDLVTNDPIPAGVTGGALLRAHGIGALSAVAPVFVTIAYVSLAAILTRSSVAALVIGLVVTTIDQVFRGLAPMLEPYAPLLVNLLYPVLPGYHTANIANWLSTGQVLEVPFAAGPFSTSVGASLAVSGGLTIVLVALTFWSFRRQDIN